MTSTTTCAYTKPQKTEVGGMTSATDGPNQNFGFASSTCVTISDAETINGFFYGDVLIGFFLLVLVTGQFFGGILNRLIGTKIKP